MRIIKTAAAAFAACAMLAGCANLTPGEQRAATGTGIGAAGGAVLGAIGGNAGLGALAGAGAGLAGGLLTNHIENKRARRLPTGLRGRPGAPVA